MPVTLKPIPFWSWNDKLNKQELFRQIDEMKSQGYGGFFIHSRVGLVTEYLSDEWMEHVRECVLYAKQVGMSAWLYDEDMWPSGYAGGIVVKENPSFRHKVFTVISLHEQEEEDVLIKELEKDKVIVIRQAPKNLDRFNNSCNIDVMNPAAVFSFLQHTHEKYKDWVGDLFGNGIEGIFTDEPG